MALGEITSSFAVVSGLETDAIPAGYRPYTDANNFTYLIMLVRNDVFTSIEESYQLKVSKSLNLCHVFILFHP